MARPRSISEEEAVERALQLFWEKGFDRASVADLSAAVGVGPSSLYNAFGSKDALFRRALDHYLATRAGFLEGVIDRANEIGTQETIREILHSAVKVYRSKTDPRGCALLQGGGAGVPHDSIACAITLELKRDIESTLRKVFEGGAKRGEELSAPPRILAKYILATMRGLSQLACDGATRLDLIAIANLAANSVVNGTA